MVLRRYSIPRRESNPTIMQPSCNTRDRFELLPPVALARSVSLLSAAV